jgi:hypothetical protein
MPSAYGALEAWRRDSLSVSSAVCSARSPLPGRGECTSHAAWSLAGSQSAERRRSSPPWRGGRKRPRSPDTASRPRPMRNASSHATSRRCCKVEGKFDRCPRARLGDSQYSSWQLGLHQQFVSYANPPTTRNGRMTCGSGKIVAALCNRRLACKQAAAGVRRRGVTRRRPADERVQCCARGFTSSSASSMPTR